MAPQKLRIYWWKAEPNFGDAINPMLLSLLCGRSPEWSDSADVSVLTCVGSIVSLAKLGWTVWGSGLISADAPIPEGLNILAVRGPRTREKLVASGYDVPPVFGDPCLLMPVVKPLPDVEIRYDWGIIPHYVDFNQPAVRRRRYLAMLTKVLGPLLRGRVLLVDPRSPIDVYWQQFASCRVIVSSSLHGLVMAEAYGKPCAWIRFASSRGIIGGEFKFRDFFEGIGKPDIQPVVVGPRFDFQALRRTVEIWQPMNWNPAPLMKSFPNWTDTWGENMVKAASHFTGLSGGHRDFS